MSRSDYIIVGGGTCGCVLAARLTEDPSCRVLMIEAGPRRESPWVRVPAGFTKLLVSDRHNWHLATEPEEGTLGRTIAVPKGKGLGGSTLINGMIMVRGQPRDYDNWSDLGAKGWSWRDLLPYFQRIEAYGGSDRTGLRGRHGPVPVAKVLDRPEIADAFIRAGCEAGYPFNDDYNGAEQAGFGWYQVNQKSGRRVSAADAYLKPALSRPNLEIVTDAMVERIILRDGRAIGVSFRRGADVEERFCDGEVILSAGAVHSPQILELSGIGDPEILARQGVATSVALPGVGANYIDHFCTRMNWRVSRPVTLNEQTRSWRLVAAVAQYALLRRGILTYATGLAHGFLAAHPGATHPDTQLFFMHASYADAAERKLDRQPGMTVGVSQMRPTSRGTIHIKAPDVTTMPAIRPNFLATEYDRICMVEGMKQTRRLMETTPMDAFRDAELTPGPDVESDAEWLDFARRDGQTIYHASGTCRMGGDDMAVVDPRLRLRGVDGLRVVDASVMPDIISGNIQNAVFVIAEKAADMIREDRKSAAQSQTIQKEAATHV
ncbi:GMC family oxidoreductase [Defluviimonas sp. SAOS-178_SWC]|uniref:GMC family oxidoreductase n=1 Tax=Defluviimonas sp. SAOS-178_SWC TaxID=3121287 RepID=UPI003221581B